MFPFFYARMQAMNRPENIIGLLVENTERIDKFLFIFFDWNSIVYNASSRFSMTPHGPKIEHSLKECMTNCDWSDAEIIGYCEAGVLLFQITKKDNITRLFFYDLLRSRCGYAVPIYHDEELIYYEVMHV